ncbi:Zinc finger RING-type [Penicillium malachiteum]|nr:Zinc finger RING-type [Penicillium malachiteum]
MDIEDFLALGAESNTEGQVDLRALDHVSSYDSHLMCPICHCPFIQPVRLQCDHVFCEKCLRSAITTFHSADSDHFPCPSCRTPTRHVSMSVPRLLINMCDEIQVQCPLSRNGCQELVPRGHIQSHVEKYCGYQLVPCPDESCDKKTRKKDLQVEKRCRHSYCRCSRCEEDVMEQDYEVLKRKGTNVSTQEHDLELCPNLRATCVDCGTMVVQRTLKNHIETCPEVVSPCAGSKYGCQARIRRAEISTHEQQCPLVAIGPYFEAQNTRINSLELNMRHLQQRNEVFEDGLANIRSTLVESSRISSRHGSGPTANTEESADRASNASSSNETTYLLSLHESLREEVNQITYALTDLDARASMSIMNECLRIKEDMAHTNAAVNTVRMQVQWLMNPRLHNDTRTASLRANGANAGAEARQLMAASAAGPSNAAGASLGQLRPRRPSDGGREGTKL